MEPAKKLADGLGTFPPGLKLVVGERLFTAALEALRHPKSELFRRAVKSSEYRSTN